MPRSIRVSRHKPGRWPSLTLIQCSRSGPVVMLSLTIFLKHNDPHAAASRYGSLKTAKAAHRNDLRCSLASSAEQNSTEKKQPQEGTPERISRLLSMANE